jgi:predicted HD superfamily hydrolase involved in NAD metabolism
MYGLRRDAAWEVHMKSEVIEQINDKLKKKLTTSRYTHTLGVAYTAACMAMRYGADMEKAYIAGLLHDCAKCMTDDDKIKKCIENGIDISDAERKTPSLLHAKLGAWYASHKYDIRDEEICSAIRYHSTGRPYMTTLEKIIFVADYIEPNRNKAPNLDAIRNLAFDDLDRAVCVVARDTLAYLVGNNADVDETTQMTYDYYASLLHKRESEQKAREKSLKKEG